MKTPIHLRHTYGSSTRLRQTYGSSTRWQQTYRASTRWRHTIGRQWGVVGYIVLYVGLCIGMAGCKPSAGEDKRFVVGVSQCNDDAWRQNMNWEMSKELLFHPELELVFMEAGANSQRQCEQIDSLVAMGIDLLIVCPNEGDEVAPAVTRAYRTGMPVVVTDRAINNNTYTAFIGGDNYEVGRLLAHFVQEEISEKRSAVPYRVLEVRGLDGSTPASLRHTGFMEGIAPLVGAGKVRVVASVSGEWFAANAEQAVDSVLTQVGQVDVIVAHNDLMGLGARSAFLRHFPNAPIAVVGVDALRGEGNGLEAVNRGELTASVTYYSRGDMVVQTAANILRHQPFLRDTIFQPFIITQASSELMLRSEQALDHEFEVIQVLQNHIDNLNETIALQHKYNIVWIVLALTAICFVFLVAYLTRYRIKTEQRKKETRQQLEEQQKRLDEMSQKLAEVEKSNDKSDQFIQRLQVEIEKRMANSELNVNGLSEAMGMSRAQLFRKTKLLMGQSPNDIIRTVRLKRAQQLLQNTDQTIQQVAYAVGFSSPSYFTKCYKEHFGNSPASKTHKD